MPDCEDFDVFIFDSVEDTVDAVTFTVEKLPHPLLAEAELGYKGALLRELSETLNGVAQSVEPFQSRSERACRDPAQPAFDTGRDTPKRFFLSCA